MCHIKINLVLALGIGTLGSQWAKASCTASAALDKQYTSLKAQYDGAASNTNQYYAAYEYAYNLWKDNSKLAQDNWTHAQNLTSWGWDGGYNKYLGDYYYSVGVYWWDYVLLYQPAYAKAKDFSDNLYNQVQTVSASITSVCAAAKKGAAPSVPESKEATPKVTDPRIVTLKIQIKNRLK